MLNCGVCVCMPTKSEKQWVLCNVGNKAEQVLVWQGA